MKEVLRKHTVKDCCVNLPSSTEKIKSLKAKKNAVKRYISSCRRVFLVMSSIKKELVDSFIH